MIIYDLTCDQNHRFEGWFQSAADFDRQSRSHFVTCPTCGSSAVTRVPSAVAIGGQAKETPVKPLAQASQSVEAGLPAGTQILGLYRQLVNAMRTVSEDVGSHFAEEARKIHYQQAPERPIRGQASDEDVESLQEEGIPVFRMADIGDDKLN